MEPADATPDLVGRTSARLLADGVGRLDGLEALRLLAVLDASTDASGVESATGTGRSVRAARRTVDSCGTMSFWPAAIRAVVLR